VFCAILISGCPLFAVMINPENVTVHAVFVSKATGEILKEYAREKKGECCIFPSHFESSWTVLTISFISFIVICAIVVLVFYTPRHLSYSQGTYYRSQSVDIETVKALPCFTFSSARSGDCHTEETCAMCLEDYKDGEILKVLPCQHGSTLVTWLIL
jgi:E3 ubiquitin-protein ligase RNF13